MQSLLDELLARDGSGGFSLTRIARADFDAPGLLTRLHAMANTWMAEPLEHFVAHAHTNDELHVLRRRTDDSVVGFQFWRMLDGDGGRMRVVLGGKLRIAPAARRRGLHLLAGLGLLAEQRQLYPDAHLTRLGIVSLFGFTALTRHLAHYDFIDARSRQRALLPIVDAVTRVSRFHFDPETGLVDVGIRVTADTLAAYPPSYFERPEARAYLHRNPGHAENGCYLAFAFDADANNVRALARGAAGYALDEKDADDWTRRWMAAWPDASRARHRHF